MANITELFVKHLQAKLYDEIQTLLKTTKKSKVEVISEIIRKKGGTGNSFLVEIHHNYYCYSNNEFIGSEVKFIEFVINPKFSFNKRRDPEEDPKSKQISTNQLSQLGNLNLPQIKWDKENNNNLTNIKKEYDFRVSSFAFLPALRPKKS